jgi:plasmid maintenance system antidote protein VapI
MGKQDHSAAMVIARDVNAQIREIIIKRIKTLGWNQSKLAERMGKSRACVSVLLTQDNILSIPTIIEFCKALDLGFDLILRERVGDAVKVSENP